jgi:Fic family protein
LILAYQFAQKNILNEINFLECHRLFSKTLVIKSNQGKYREEKVGVFGQSGLVYLTIEPEYVKETLTEFFTDIEILLNLSLTSAQVFYYASIIHIKFAHIHPFMDGNGRAAHLIEKWFIAEKLGNDFWKIQSEKYYKEHQSEYYKNLNLGVDYYHINYDKCIPFLLMLPNCLEND